MITPRNLRYGAVLALILIAAAACSSDDSDGSSSTSSSSPSSASPLQGTQWALQDSPDIPAVGVEVTAEFKDGGQLTGNSGCNTYNAPFTTDGTDLTIGPEIAGTRMACDPAPMAVERVYLRVLPDIASFEITDTTLRLLDGNDVARLVYGSSDGATAIIGSWTATTYFTGDALKSPVVGSTLTAEFDDAEVSGNAGCNTFGGPYELSDTTITIGPFRSTLKACTDPELEAQEQQYLAALELARSYRVTGSTLGLLRANGSVAATFERVTR